MRSLPLLVSVLVLTACGSRHEAKAPADAPRSAPQTRAVRPWEKPVAWREITVVRHGRPGSVPIAHEGTKGRMIVDDLPRGYTIWEFEVDCPARRFIQGRGHGYDVGSPIERAPDPVQAFVASDAVDRICASDFGSSARSPQQVVDDLMKKAGMRSPSPGTRFPDESRLRR